MCVADVPVAGSRVNAGEPVCSVLAFARDQVSAIAALSGKLDELSRVVPMVPEDVVRDISANCGVSAP